MSDAVAERELPKYECHKFVRALKIAKVEKVLNPADGCTLTPADTRHPPFFVGAEWCGRFRGWDGVDLGYYVVYKDGYASWSPSNVFEEGYTLIE